jgi:indole-3-glycerol phosphate synthase
VPLVWAEFSTQASRSIKRAAFSLLIFVYVQKNSNNCRVKTVSPFGYKSEKSWEEMFEIANRIGDIISIHTDARWNGSFELIKKAKSMTDKSILAKGIHATDDEIEKAIAAGADYVLVVGRIPKVHLDKCLIEPLTLAELKTIPPNMKVVWNSRDLSNGGMKTETFEEARQIFSGWMCQASNLKTVADIKAGVDAVLVGTNLVEFAKSL